MERILSRRGITLLLIAVNIGMFLYVEFHGGTEDLDTMLKYGGAFTPYILDRGEYYRLFTANFLHFGIEHLANNMVVLFLLGDNLERALGHVKYLILYLLAGIGANALSMGAEVNFNEFAVSAGASGAIFGVMGALIYVLLRNRGKLEDLSLPQMVVALGLMLYTGFTSPGVDNVAHVGGALSGLVLCVLLYHKPRNPRRREELYSWQ